MRFYKLSYDFDSGKADEISKRDELVGWCPLYGGQHARIVKILEDEVTLTIDLPFPKIGDFLTTWTWEWMITDKVAQLFKEQGFTGYKLRPVKINQVKRMRKTSAPIPKLWEFVVTGFAGMAHPDSGIKMIYKCEYCDLIEYSTFSNPASLIDVSQWDGSDFFFIYPIPGYIFITERVKDFIENTRLTACEIIPLDKVKPGSSTLVGGTLYYQADRVSLERLKAFGEPLGLWVEPEKLWQRLIQLPEGQMWPDGLGKGDTPWDKEWYDFLMGYMRPYNGIISQELVFEQLEKMLKKYKIVQAIEDIERKIEELKKIRF